jgi:cyclopropane-fatty-acyl-phospholipid synthase
MFEPKVLADVMLRVLLRYGRVSVTYWDGSTVQYTGWRGLNEPVLRVTIKHPSVVQSMLINASLAVGEGYMSGRLVIDEEQLPLFFKLIARNQPRKKVSQPFRRNHNHKEAQQGYIESHYSVSNRYYQLFLDPTCTYSCAYFKRWGQDSLEQAQHQKIAHILRKLRLEPGMRLLDIGCGWGHLAVAAAKQYDVQVLGITLSTAQLEGARELAEREGVSHLVRFELMNYQDLPADEPFDRIVSVGMFEHVGHGNRDQYFGKVAELLVPGGVSLLHTITQQQSRPVDAWIDKYIFPGGYLPTVAEIEDGLASHGLWSIDRENLWRHYAETLRMWREAHRQNRTRIIEMFDERFYRARDFWLAGSEAGFRYGQLGLTQVVFTKGKPEDGTWPETREYLYQD